MPDSPPARRILTNAMKPEPETPFDRYLRDVEPKLPDRYRFPGKRRMSPWRELPAIGISVVALGLIAMWIAGLLGLR